MNLLIKNRKLSKILIYLILSIFCCSFLQVVFQHGLFFDGLTYSSISQILSKNFGDLWHIKASLCNPYFYEHPPLFFWIEGLFFKFLGDAFYVERVFCLFINLLVIIGVALNWKVIYKKTIFENHFWLPIILLITMRSYMFVFNNNMLEILVTLFVVYAHYYILIFLKTQNKYSLIVSVLFIFCAFLTKGPIGLFPIVIILIYFYIFKNITIKKAISNSIYMLVFGIIMLCFLFVLFPQSFEFIKQYLRQQVLSAIRNKREVTVTNRFSIIFRLIEELVIPLILILIFYLQNKKILKNKISIYFILIGISASLPLIITLKQFPHYFVPSLPFYILGLSSFIIKPLLKILIKINIKIYKFLHLISIILLCVSLFLSYFNFNLYLRDKSLVSDSIKLNLHIKNNNTITISSNMCSYFPDISYISRYTTKLISCNKIGCDYYITLKTDSLSKEYKELYKKENINLIGYNLYKLK